MDRNVRRKIGTYGFRAQQFNNTYYIKILTPNNEKRTIELNPVSYMHYKYFDNLIRSNIIDLHIEYELTDEIVTRLNSNKTYINIEYYDQYTANNYSLTPTSKIIKLLFCNAVVNNLFYFSIPEDILCSSNNFYTSIRSNAITDELCYQLDICKIRNKYYDTNNFLKLFLPVTIVINSYNEIYLLNVFDKIIGADKVHTHIARDKTYRLPIPFDPELSREQFIKWYNSFINTRIQLRYCMNPYYINLFLEIGSQLHI